MIRLNRYFPSAALSAVFAAVVFLSVGVGNATRETNDNRFPEVPAWAKSAVWYQIFPERFRNGDSSNDPQPGDLAGSWPHEVAQGWHISSWTGDWYALQPWERADGKGFYYHAQQRRYGGDLKGVIDKLDYLKELGVNAIYFNPLFESPSLHKYDASSFHHIDNNFGPDPAGDRKIWSAESPGDPATWKWTSADKLFLNLIQEAHNRGMKVVIDGVFNHVGITFWAFEDVKKNQQGSSYKDWFRIKRWDDRSTAGSEFEYEGWNGVRELPEIREDENGLVQGPREHVHAVVRRWMDPNGDGRPDDGIDGWRLDVAEKVKLSFWRSFRTWVREINPEAYIVGEVWWEDWSAGKMYDAAPWLQGDAFDAVMNYRWAREAFRFFAGKKTGITASEFSRRLDAIRNDYPAEVNKVLLNLYDSHDTDRLSSHIVNGDLSYDQRVGVSDNRDYDVRKPNENEIAEQKLMALFQMTYVGAPTVYYGTEAGMWGADDPDERKPMLWPDLTYKAESSHPFNKPRPSDSNVYNQELFEYYKGVIDLRKKYKAFSTGSYFSLLNDDKQGVFCFMRSEGKQVLIVALNNSTAMQQTQVKLPDSLSSLVWKGLMNPANSQATTGSLRLTLKPKSGEVLSSVP